MVSNIDLVLQRLVHYSLPSSPTDRLILVVLKPSGMSTWDHRLHNIVASETSYSRPTKALREVQV